MTAAMSIADDELFGLRGKVAIVTGSTRGIGLGIARAYAMRGARVVVSSRKADACEAARASIVDAGGAAIAVPCNVGDKAALRSLVDATLDAYGTIDVVVCNAAVNPYLGPLSGISDEAFDKIMNTNVRSNVWLCNMVRPVMARGGGGAIVIVSSIAGLRGSRSLGAYGISKAADAQLARNLAVELGPHDIRVNAIAPGVIKTDFAKALYADPATERSVTAHYPIGRLGVVEDVTGIAVMLAARAGSFVTGQTIVVDGGTTIGGFD